MFCVEEKVRRHKTIRTVDYHEQYLLPSFCKESVRFPRVAYNNDLRARGSIVTYKYTIRRHFPLSQQTRRTVIYTIVRHFVSLPQLREAGDLPGRVGASLVLHPLPGHPQHAADPPRKVLRG